MSLRSHYGIVAMLFGMLWTATSAQDLPQLGKSPISDVVKAMTLEEKVDIVVGNGFNIPGFNMPGMPVSVPSEAQKRVPGASGAIRGVPRLGVPSIVVCDGPAGLHVFNSGASRLYYATAWPVGTLLASSWDTTLVKKVGTALGQEAKEYGIDVLLGPGMNIHRNPLGARNFEYYSEDPVITGYIAAAMISGIQSNGVGTSAKHFAANNQETNRSTVNTIVSERALREVYLRGWEIALKKSNPWTIMSSYNLLNGTYTSQNAELLQTILRKDWGYKGMVMSDWFGGTDPVAQLKAKNNLIMPGTPNQSSAILEAVKSGTLPMSVLDENVASILEMMVKTPIFNKYKYSDQPDLQKNAAIARAAAAESMVLLKNNDKTLPLAKATTVAVFGNNAFELIAGGTGSGDVNKMYAVPLTEGLFNAGLALDPILFSDYHDYVYAELARRPKQNVMQEMMNPTKPIAQFPVSDEAITKAAASDQVAVIAIGRNAGEGTDRKVENDYYLTDVEKQLINKVSDAFHIQNKKVVIVLNIGGVIDVTQWRDKADAILLAWQPGLEGGNAIADVITGRVNPSGKLATTFPASYNDVPSAKTFPGKEFKDRPVKGMFGMPAFEAEVTYDEGIYVGYRYYTTFGIKPAYEFGYGLSYTDFTYNDAKVSSATFKDSISVKVTITNAGAVAGKEVVQLYLTAPAGKLDKPAVELKTFAKTRLLQAGESETLTFSLSPRDLASFNTTTSSWVADAGTYTVKFGSSTATKATALFKLPKAILVEKVSKAVAPVVTINELKPTKK